MSIPPIQLHTSPSSRPSGNPAQNGRVSRNTLRAAKRFMHNNWAGMKGAAVQATTVTSLCAGGFAVSPFLGGMFALLSITCLPFHRLLMLRGESSFREKVLHNYQLLDLDTLAQADIPIVREEEIFRPRPQSLAFVDNTVRAIALRPGLSPYDEAVLITHETAHIERYASEFLAERTANRLFDSLPLKGKYSFFIQAPKRFAIRLLNLYLPTLMYNRRAYRYLKYDRLNMYEALTFALWDDRVTAKEARDLLLGTDTGGWDTSWLKDGVR